MCDIGWNGRRLSRSDIGPELELGKAITEIVP